MTTKQELDGLTYEIIGAAIEVHKALGPGLLESVYQKCLQKEFSFRKLSYKSELLVPIHYKGIDVDAELRCDFLIEDEIVVELKAINTLVEENEHQLVNYLKATTIEIGLLLNFGKKPQIKRKIFDNDKKKMVK